MKLILSLFVLIISQINQKSLCQPCLGKDFVNLEVEIKAIDSDYIIIPKLINNSKSEIIFIPKQFSYRGGREVSEYFTGSIILRKQIGKVYVFLTVDEIQDPFLDDSGHLFTRRFGKKDRLADSLYLKDYFPIEKGEYSLMLILSFKYKGRKYCVQSDWLNFKEDFIPKNAPYN